MIGHRRFRLLLILFFSVSCSSAGESSAQTPIKILASHNVGEFEVYFLRAELRDTTLPIITTDEGLRSGALRIYETNSYKLRAENRSDSMVFIQAGDLLKGGQQDRLVVHDLLLAPRQTSPLEIFCIEKDRSFVRPPEPLEYFNSSVWSAPSVVLRSAEQFPFPAPTSGGEVTSPEYTGKNDEPKSGDLVELLGQIPQNEQAERDTLQATIWKNIETLQNKWSRKVGRNIRDTAFRSSLVLAMDNTSQTLSKFLGSAIPNSANGAAIFQGGKLLFMDCYGSTQLFNAEWQKLAHSLRLEESAESLQPLTDEAHAEKLLNDLLNVRRRSTSAKLFNTFTAMTRQRIDDYSMYLTKDPETGYFWHFRLLTDP